MSAQSVLIVGAGPTGMTAAIECKRVGFDVRIIDKSDHMARWSQALVLQARTLEQMQRYGVAAEAVSRGRKVCEARLWSEGKEIVHVDLGKIQSTYAYALFIPQTETEAILDRHMEALGVKAERGTVLTNLQQFAGEVRATVRHADGSEEHIQPRWVLGCDGAHSTVRQRMQIPFEGSSIGLSFWLADVEMDGPDAPDQELSLHLHHGDVLFMARLDDRLTRIIVASHAQSNQEVEPELTIGDFQSALDRMSLRAVIRRAEWMTPFHVNDRQARHYRLGNVFLAGDASHIHSPVGGQGMNTGMQDVANLVWKLAAVARGADESLLDSYEEERGEVGRALLRFTERALRMVTSESRIVEGVRDRLMPLLSHMRTVQKDALGFVSEIAIEYQNSSIVQDHGGDGELRAGDRFPDLAYREGGSGTLLGDWTEPCHLAFLHNGSEAEAEEIRSRLGGAKVCRTRSAEMANEGRRLLGAEKKLVIVRPDGYVGLRAPVGRNDDWLVYARRDRIA